MATKKIDTKSQKLLTSTSDSKIKKSPRKSLKKTSEQLQINKIKPVVAKLILDSKSLTVRNRSVGEKISKSDQARITSTQHIQTNQSFLAFILFLVISGFLVGGLFASFNAYQSLILNNTTASSTRKLPATGLVKEAENPTPQPIVTEPSNVSTAEVPKSESKSESTPAIATDSVADKRQPTGTTEFNSGNYKVYQYPDGNIVVVW